MQAARDPGTKTTNSKTKKGRSACCSEDGDSCTAEGSVPGPGSSKRERTQVAAREGWGIRKVRVIQGTCVIKTLQEGGGGGGHREPHNTREARPHRRGENGEVKRMA